MPFSFERLDVWKRSLSFADDMMTVAERLPEIYRYSLCDQLRRAALSVPTNIAEGTGRETARDRAHFYSIAKGSLFEVISLLTIATRRSCIAEEQYRQCYQEADEIAAMLSGLIKNSK